MPRLLSAVLLALGVALAAGPISQAAEQGRFTFRDAEFMSDDDALQAVHRFVAALLPAGISLDEARARVAKAAMTCARPKAATGAVSCGFSMVVHLDGGLLGEDAWTVRLIPDQAGNLGSATVTHEIIGTGRPNPQ